MDGGLKPTDPKLAGRLATAGTSGDHVNIVNMLAHVSRHTHNQELKRFRTCVLKRVHVA